MSCWHEAPQMKKSVHVVKLAKTKNESEGVCVRACVCIVLWDNALTEEEGDKG